MKVMKFGGSSVKDAQKIKHVCSIAAEANKHEPVALVFSAMKGITDMLIEAAGLAEAGDTAYRNLVQEIGRRQTEAVEELFTLPDRPTISEAITGLLEELADILHGVELVKECSERTMDMVMSFGERINNRLIAAYLSASGTPASYIDARQMIVTDDTHGSAKVDFELSYPRIKARIKATEGIPVVTGFIAATPLGITTTLGRNGSDYTASLLGAASDASRVEIWTDVDGVLSADPRLVPTAFVVPEISIQDAMELSYFGAEVIHPYTMIPAVDREIAIYIKNTLRPEVPGTRIAADIKKNEAPITGIASIENVALINVEGGGMLGHPGVASRVFHTLAEAKVNIIMISQASSEHSICMVCREKEAPRAMLALQTELEKELHYRMIQNIELVEELEIIAVVGENMRGTPGISGRLFSALGDNGINVLAIAQGSSERNISFVIERNQRSEALNAVHNAFLSGGKCMSLAFASTRSPDKKISFKEAVFRGLAPDGGLYHPDGTPDLRELFASITPAAPFAETAASVLHALLPDEFSRDEAAAVCRRAFPFGPELRKMSDDISILELFHGPSCAFKDFGASFLAAVMDSILAGRDEKAVILTATSGDTGSAVARAFYGSENIDVVILYPSGRVSPLQEKQLTTLGGNISALEVKGNFDDCQRMVKEAFVDRELIQRISLSSANSINLGRLLPQSFYYIWARSQFDSERPFIFCVPSGNFGNLTAGVLAWSWGLEVDRFLAATNANDVVPEYLATSTFSPRPSVHTYSNAMDVGDPSNFERLLAIFDNNWEEMGAVIKGDTVTDTETVATIARLASERQQILCPHTAVGYLAAERFLDAYRGDTRPQIVTLATAAPGKFTEIVEEATGSKPPLPPQLEELLQLKKESTVVENSLEALKGYLLERFGQ